MKPIKPMTAVATGALATSLSALFVQLLRNGGHTVPSHSWWEGALIVALIAGLLAAGWRVRTMSEARSRAYREANAARRVGMSDDEISYAAAEALRDVRQLAPEGARRILVFAQAAILGGAVMEGWYAGAALVLINRAREGFGVSGEVLLTILALLGITFSVAGFVVQRWCTVPQDER